MNAKGGSCYLNMLSLALSLKNIILPVIVIIIVAIIQGNKRKQLAANNAYATTNYVAYTTVNPVLSNSTASGYLQPTAYSQSATRSFSANDVSSTTR